jgi:hypothetical protein
VTFFSVSFICFSEREEEDSVEAISVDMLAKKVQLGGILERVCQELELSNTQYELAKGRYESVGAWLAESEDPLLRETEVYPQGSMSLGTTVRPLTREEHDIDLVSFEPRLLPDTPPALLKQAVGARLRDNRRYREILEEKSRCWRLVYPNEFHLDITPSIRNPGCGHGGELVPEKQGPHWKPTNPKGYRTLFEERARLQPRIRLFETDFAKMRAQVEELPKPTYFKGLLRRSVQICKRHRDVWFSTREQKLAPISIVLTTLAAKSYAHCVANNVYDTELDLFLDLVRRMPAFVETRDEAGRKRYFVWNETTDGENFAEKWNADPRLATAFFSWQAEALRDLRDLSLLTGYELIGRELGRRLGEGPVSKAMNSLTSAVSAARASNTLRAVPGLGLSTGTRGVPVRTNTFFGR